jgi:uncharacterized membrane protein YsdA (DUF1294 family)
MLYLIIYFILINLIAFMMYGIDKRKAKMNKWRIKESSLLTLSLIGGGLGSMFAMQIFHHKTNKNKFKLGVPLLTFISIIIFYFIINNFF